jgi:tRNA-splicing ligase RtcB
MGGGAGAAILGAEVTETVHNHHNYAWRERHRDRDYWVVRKGATPAFPGQKGFVGGSMGDNAVIIEGVDSARSAESLYSTVHGAGPAVQPHPGEEDVQQDGDGRVDGRARHPSARARIWTRARWLIAGSARCCGSTKGRCVSCMICGPSW